MVKQLNQRQYFLLLYFAAMEMHFRFRLLLRKGKVGASGFCAKFAHAIIQACFYDSNIPLLLAKRSPQHHMRVVGRYGFAEAGFHFRCHPAGLQLAEHDPAADFIQQYGLDASMQRIQPPLILGRGFQMLTTSSPSS